MTIQSTILKINRELISAFALLDGYFDRDDKFLFSKTTEKWSAIEILEHVMLTNRYLLILIEKGAARAKAIALETNVSEAVKDYEIESESLKEIGIHKSFQWTNPKHMEPTGNRTPMEIRLELRNQLHQCLCLIDSLRRGEGALYKITMTVHNLGKLDVYQYTYFLALHVKRHITQLERQAIDSQLSVC